MRRAALLAALLLCAGCGPGADAMQLQPARVPLITVVSLSSNQSIPNDGNPYVITNFGTVRIDENGAWSASNPSRFTIPSGCRLSRFTVHVEFLAGMSAGVPVRLTQQLNGALIPYGTGQHATVSMPGGTTHLQDSGGWYLPTPGDYYEATVAQQSANGADAIQTTSWGQLECLP